MKDPLRLGHLAADLEKTRCGRGKPIWLAMAFLLRAAVYAHDVKRGLWDFAVESRELSEFGLGQADFRWLVLKGYVDHAREITKRSDTERAFEAAGSFVVGRRSCFVLTESGLERAIAWGCGSAIQRPEILAEKEVSKNSDGHLAIVPKWDADYRVITYNGIVVKQFKLPSPNQIAILSAFEEEGWPPHIDDPLPPRADVDPKQRLHDTIRSINRNQRHELICFRGDGTGRGIVWLPRESHTDLDDEDSTKSR